MSEAGTPKVGPIGHRRDDFGTITVPRPKPDHVAIAITDAAGASAWTACLKTDLAELGTQLVAILEEAQGIVHEQREQDGKPA